MGHYGDYSAYGLTREVTRLYETFQRDSGDASGVSDSATEWRSTIADELERDRAAVEQQVNKPDRRAAEQEVKRDIAALKAVDLLIKESESRDKPSRKLGRLVRGLQHRPEKGLRALLAKSGVQINGPNPWDPQINDERFFARIFRDWSLGLGESYMDGWWNVPKIDEFISKILTSKVDSRALWKIALSNPQMAFQSIMSKLRNLQSIGRSRIVGEEHYDTGNDLFEKMLSDKYMQYTCGYWPEGVENLEQAQAAKLDLICRKLGLDTFERDNGRPPRVLDIGCGWGGLARYMASKYGAEVVGLTISEEQRTFAQEKAESEGLGELIEIRNQDYREMPRTEKFDLAVSVGMFEHVGEKNYQSYMNVVDRVLEPGGKFVLHTISANHEGSGTNPFLNKYIFPNGVIPKDHDIVRTSDKAGLIFEDMQDIGVSYDKTLMAWQRNFEEAYPDLDHKKYPERFRRMWNFYLLTCAAAFRTRRMQLHQFCFAKKATEGLTTETPKQPVIAR